MQVTNISVRDLATTLRHSGESRSSGLSCPARLLLSCCRHRGGNDGGTIAPRPPDLEVKFIIAASPIRSLLQETHVSKHVLCEFVLECNARLVWLDQAEVRRLVLRGGKCLALFTIVVFALGWQWEEKSSDVCTQDRFRLRW